jgi:hypothetical protein
MRIDDDDVHAAASPPEPLRSARGEKRAMPAAAPSRVTWLEPEAGALMETTLLKSGASNVNCSETLPRSSPSVVVTLRRLDAPASVLQAIDESAAHELAPHAEPPRRTAGESAAAPADAPRSVTLVAPEAGALSRTVALGFGASAVKVRVRVKATKGTEAASRQDVLETPEKRPVSCVVDTHSEAWLVVPPTRALGDEPRETIEAPRSVTLVAPVGGALDTIAAVSSE